MLHSVLISNTLPLYMILILGRFYNPVMFFYILPFYRILIFRRFHTPVMFFNILLFTGYWASEDSTLTSCYLIFFFLQEIDLRKILHSLMFFNLFFLFTEYWSSEDSTLPSCSLIFFFLQDIDLQKILHSRQLGLKLIANVTYGYTSASFSGRMPCVEVADSVVAKVYSNISFSHTWT